MPGCATCTTTNGLQVCLFCGRSYCSNHRAESGGLPACMACLAEERARAERVTAAAAALPARRGASGRAAARGAAGSSTTSDRVGSIGTDVLEVDGSRPVAPPPLPEPDPPQTVPLVLAALAGGPAALYLHWLFTKLATDVELPGWTPLAGAALGTTFVAGAVWVIARSRMSR